MSSRHRALLVIIVLLVCAVASSVVALAVGSVQVPFSEVLSALFGGMADDSIGGISSENVAIVRELRLPRTMAGFACGGLLALAGALMQILLRNPLADPYVLGISGGASVGAMVAILLGFTAVGLNGIAFLGAFVAIITVFGLAHGDGAWTQTRLLLTGVIVAAGCGALVALMLTIAPEHKLRGMLFWLMGDLSQTGVPWPALVVLLFALLAAMPCARELNLLARGQDTAQALGVDVRRLRYAVYAIASLVTAVAVTNAGSIGFVGMIVPHLVRLTVGNDQRLLLPAAVLAGGTLLTVADTLARTIAAPQQLPVGVLTALIGVPIFLLLLVRQRQ